MRRYHQRLIRFFALLLCAALLCPALPGGLAEEAEAASVPRDLHVATLSDLRYYPDALAGDKGEAYFSYLGAAGVNGRDQDAILDAAFASLRSQAKRGGLDCLVVCGNLTAGGEYAGADAIARKLRVFSLETGVRVFVLNGDRDINNPGASDFSSNRKQPAANVSPAQFVELFGDFGYLSAHHVYKVLGSGTQGALTYSVKLPEGYRLIMADICRYTADCTSSHLDECETAAGFSEELRQWVLTEAADAKKDGEVPLLFTHAGVVPVNAFQEKLLPGTLADDAYLLRDALADAGVLCAFSGAAAASDTGVYYSDAGCPLYAVASPSVTRFPFAYRVANLAFNADGSAALSFDWHDCDETVDVRTAGGGVYPTPYRAIGFAKQFGGTDPEKYFCALAREKLDALCADIIKAGGVTAYVEKLFGVDVRDAIYGSVGDGIRFGPVTLLSASHVMSAIEDLDASVMERYVRRPANLYAAADRAVKAFLSLQASDIPCTRYLDTYGFGSQTRGGTLGELALDLIAAFLPGNESMEGDAFLQDALSEDGMAALVARLVETFRTEVVDGIFVNEILAHTEFRVRTLFTAETDPIAEYTELVFSAALAVLASRLMTAQDGQQAWSALTRLATDGKTVSVGSLIDLLLDAGNAGSGRTVDAFLDTVFSLLCGEEQQAAMADSLSGLLKSLVTDATPDTGAAAALAYRGPEEPPTDAATMRVPAMVQLAVNSNTSFTVTWFTKHTVTGTDMEIVKEGSPFTGVPTRSDFIAADTTETTLNGFGFDCGNYGFLPYAVKAVRHVVTVRNLAANTKLRFRIGDAAKGFWKECSFETGSPDGGSAYTFLNITDSDGVTKASAGAFGAALRAAREELSPAFIVHSGNLVRYPWNDAQWSRALDGAADVFNGVPLMYASGANDADGYYSVQKHLTCSRTPLQYQEDGVYYSFDYGRAHFTVLNTNSLQADGTLSARQEEWLKADLAAVAGWKILVMYAPVFCVENANLKLESQMREIVADNKVDLVLQGGAGGYVRSYLLKDGAPTDAYTVSSVSYGGRNYQVMEASGACIVSSCAPFTGSAPLREVRNTFAAVAQDFTTPVFSAVTVDGNTLYVNAYSVEEGKLERVDSFALRKDAVTFLLGDADLDGEVTPEDARLTLRVAVGLDTVTPITKAAADLDGDVYITPEDARLVLRTSVGLEQPPKKVSRFVYEIAAYKNA